MGRSVLTWNLRKRHQVCAQIEKFSKSVPPVTLKIHSLAVHKFLCKTFFKLLKLILGKTFLWMILKRKRYTRLIYYLIKLMKRLSVKISFFTSSSLSHCFSRLSAFLYSMPFRNDKMYCKIIGCYSTYLLKCNWKRKTWKVFFGCQILGAQTGIPVSQTAWIRHCVLRLLLVDQKSFCHQS